MRSWPLIGEPIYQFWGLASSNLQAALAKIAPHLEPIGRGLLGIAADAGSGVLQFLIALAVAEFLYAPAPLLVDAIGKFSRRLASGRGQEFVRLAAATIRAVSRGVIGVSVLQAFFAGLGLMAIDIPGASLITSAVLILGIIQVGPSIVLIPVIIWSWTVKETTTAVLFTAYMIPVNLMDNILRPVVMGRGLDTPTLVILIGVIGGHGLLRDHGPVSGPHCSGLDLGASGGVDRGRQGRLDLPRLLAISAGLISHIRGNLACPRGIGSCNAFRFGHSQPQPG